VEPQPVSRPHRLLVEVVADYCRHSGERRPFVGLLFRQRPGGQLGTRGVADGLMLSPRGTSPLSLAMLVGNVSILLTRRQPQDHIGKARAEAFMGGDKNTPCQ
jgi:hypothetical protein